MMKLTIGKDDIQAVLAKYGGSNAVAGYVEEAKMFAFPLPKYYVAVIDEANLTLVQMDMKFREKAAEVLPLSTITDVKISNMIVKKVTIKTTNTTYRILIRPLSIGIGDEQKELLRRFESMAN